MKLSDYHATYGLAGSITFDKTASSIAFDFPKGETEANVTINVGGHVFQRRMRLVSDVSENSDIDLAFVIDRCVDKTAAAPPLKAVAKVAASPVTDKRWETPPPPKGLESDGIGAVQTSPIVDEAVEDRFKPAEGPGDVLAEPALDWTDPVKALERMEEQEDAKESREAAARESQEITDMNKKVLVEAMAAGAAQRAPKRNRR